MRRFSETFNSILLEITSIAAQLSQMSMAVCTTETGTSFQPHEAIIIWSTGCTSTKGRRKVVSRMFSKIKNGNLFFNDSKIRRKRQAQRQHQYIAKWQR